MKQLKVTILGCGSSGGVPRVGTGWGQCDPANPRNRRRRCSILVELLGPGGATTILVDTSPDLRDQLLDAEVTRLDASQQALDADIASAHARAAARLIDRLSGRLGRNRVMRLLPHASHIPEAAEKRVPKTERSEPRASTSWRRLPSSTG